MKMRWWLFIGWLWPFIVAGMGVAIIGTGLSSLHSDAEIHFMMLLALIGAPAVGISISKCLPQTWSARLRDPVTILLMVPVLATELFLALLVFAWGANATGYGWIE